MHFKKSSKFPGFSAAHKILNSKVEFQKLVVDDSTRGFTKLKSDIGTINNIEEKFDIVLLFGVLYHLPNPTMVIQKLFENTVVLGTSCWYGSLFRVLFLLASNI